MSRGLGHSQRLVLTALLNLEAEYGIGVFRLDLVLARCDALLAGETDARGDLGRKTIAQLGTALKPARAVPLLAKRGLVHLDGYGHVGLSEAGRVCVRRGFQ